jgi:hypothetical protein
MFLNNLVHALQKPINALGTALGGVSLSAAGSHVATAEHQAASIEWVQVLGIVGLVLGAMASLLVCLVQLWTLWDKWQKYKRNRITDTQTKA